MDIFRERQKKIEKVNFLVQEGRMDEAESLTSSTAIPDKEIHLRLINVCTYNCILNNLLSH